MIYRDSSIPWQYQYVAELHDNYIIWAKDSQMRTTQSYSVYIQYFNPSFCVFTTAYTPREFNTMSCKFNYDWNSGQLDTLSINKVLNCYYVSEDFVSSEDTARSDYINIFWGQFLCVVIVVWVFKQLSRLFFKGGLS